MNYVKYDKNDVVNGEGTRCTLFVSGCDHKCKGCYNTTTWKTDAGHKFTQELEDQIIQDLKDKKVKLDGISISGGEPLHPNNVQDVYKLVRRVKLETSKNIWIWSGYTYEDMNDMQLAVLDFCDVLIDGKFEQELADPSLKWRGSKNQRIINLAQEAFNDIDHFSHLEVTATVKK